MGNNKLSYGLGRNSVQRLAYLLSVFAMVFSSFSLTISTANSAELIMQCDHSNKEETADNTSLSCDFRLTEPRQLEELAFTANGEVLKGTEFQAFSDGDEKSAWLYLIDRSNPRRAQTVARNVDLVRGQLRNISPKRLIGVATFASDLTIVMPPASNHDGTETKLSSIVADGAATEYFANALEAIKILDGVDAERKVLVIMSDGKAEDTAYSREDVVKAASDNNVTIIGLGFAESATETPALQEIERLAEETNGYYASVVGAEAFSSEFLSSLPRYIENGGTITAPVEGLSGLVEAGLSVTVVGGQIFTTKETVDLGEAAPVEEPEAEPVPLPLIAKIYAIFGGEDGKAAQWANVNRPLAWALLIALAAVILGLIYALAFRKTDDEPTEIGLPPEDFEDAYPEDDTETFFEEEDDSTRVVDAVETAASYFEVVGSEDTKFEITAQSVSIGRHTDNDIQLSNDSVHRHHAHFHVSPQGTPTIHDLNTTNGVYINGEKKDKAELKSGDVVEFGEVRLRFVSEN